MLTPVPQMRRDPSLSATPASVAEPPGVTEESTAPFSKLDTLECSAIKQVPSKFKRAPDFRVLDPDTRTEYSEAALRLDIERIERTEHYMRLDNIALLAGAWDLHPDSPQHRPASPIVDLTFINCSMFEGVAGALCVAVSLYVIECTYDCLDGRFTEHTGEFEFKNTTQRFEKCAWCLDEWGFFHAHRIGTLR
jgi:hypothetical protein